MANKKTTRRTSGSSSGYAARWQRYEYLKTIYTALASSSLEYERACRRAAAEAGV